MENVVDINPLKRESKLFEAVVGKGRTRVESAYLATIAECEVDADMLRHAFVYALLETAVDVGGGGEIWRDFVAEACQEVVANHFGKMGYQKS